jgi:hypothetical protein
MNLIINKEKPTPDGHLLFASDMYAIKGETFSVCRFPPIPSEQKEPNRPEYISDPTCCIMPTFFYLLYIKCRSILILSIIHLLNSDRK